jgi:ribosomal protein S18 acetylase RimI-like enzyme
MTSIAAVVIRRGAVADAPALARFAADTFTEAFGDVTSPADLTAHLANTYSPALQAAELADPDVITLLALRDEGIVAYAQVRRTADAPECIDSRDTVEVSRFYADRSVRGSGVPRRLMQRSLDAALELGGRHAWLGVWENNPRAIAFYRKLGFVPVGRKIYVVGSDHQTDHVMLVSNIDTRKQE